MLVGMSAMTTVCPGGLRLKPTCSKGWLLLVPMKIFQLQLNYSQSGTLNSQAKEQESLYPNLSSFLFAFASPRTVLKKVVLSGTQVHS